MVKHKIRKLVSLVMAITILACVLPLANAADTRASDYFWRTDATIAPTGNGNIAVDFNVVAAETMKEVGASKIVIYEKQSNGTYKDVKTFTRYNTPNLIESESLGFAMRVSYKGAPGVKYYAVITFYAKNAQGSATRKETTQIITA